MTDPISRARAVLKAPAHGPMGEVVVVPNARAVTLARNALPALLDVLEAVRCARTAHTAYCFSRDIPTECVCGNAGRCAAIDRALRVLEEEVGR